MKNYSICETPSNYILEKGLVHFQGRLIIKKKNSSPIFLLNKQPVKVELLDAKLPNSNQNLVKWAFHYVIDENVWNERGVIELEIRESDNLVGRHNWRIEKSFISTRPPITAFLHMPKCAGSSIRVQLDKYSHIFSGQAIYPQTNDDETQRNIFSELRQETNVVYGHFRFGIHKSTNRQVRYITILREPLQFIKSQYFFAKYTGASQIFTDGTTFLQALEKAPSIFDNIFTRWISNASEKSEVREDDFLRACDNIKNHFDIIGFAESMCETNRLLERYFGLPFRNKIVNRTPHSIESKEWKGKNYKTLLENKIYWDLKLYKFAKKHKNVFM